MLTLCGLLGKFWRILTPKTDIKLYPNITKLGTIIKHTLLSSITNYYIQIPNFQTAIIIVWLGLICTLNSVCTIL